MSAAAANVMETHRTDNIVATLNNDARDVAAEVRVSNNVRDKIQGLLLTSCLSTALRVAGRRASSPVKVEKL